MATCSQGQTEPGSPRWGGGTRNCSKLKGMPTECGRHRLVEIPTSFPEDTPMYAAPPPRRPSRAARGRGAHCIRAGPLPDLLPTVVNHVRSKESWSSLSVSVRASSSSQPSHPTRCSVGTEANVFGYFFFQSSPVVSVAINQRLGRRTVFRLGFGLQVIGSSSFNLCFG